MTTWKINLALRLALIVGVAVTAVARAAHGEVDANAAPAAAPTLTPPKLLTFVPAKSPESAGTPPRTEPVDVDVELTIDATGKVTEARVPAPVGGMEAFEAAALEAVKQFVFEPAKRGDTPIPSRIKYRYLFEPPPPPAPTTGALEGTVIVRATGLPAAGAAVSVRSISAEPAAAPLAFDVVTDASGAFKLPELPPGRYEVKLAGVALAPITVTEDVTVGEVTAVTYRLDAPAPVATGKTLEFGATATIEAPPREVTKRTFDAGELMRMAGTRGDPLRAIEYMPGVGRSPIANFVIIRGSSPLDSEVQFEGAPVYRLYHFGGLTSFVQPRLVEKIDLYPGNFSARYGRKMGGIIDVGIRDPKTDRLHGLIDVNVIDSSFLFEGPLAKNWSFAVAAKRSYIDFFFDKLVPKDEVQVLAAPVYWDYQAMVVYKPSDRDRVRAMVYGSYDDFKIILANPAEADPAIRGQLSSYSGFHRASLLWQHRYDADGRLEHEITTSVGPYSFGQQAGPNLSLDVPGWSYFLRAEWRARVTETFRLIGGLDIQDNWASPKYNGPALTQLDGDPDTFGNVTGRENVQVARGFNFFHPAAYLEGVWRPVSRLTIVPGVRVDHLREIDAWMVDPRITGRFELTARTTLKGGVGLFSQAPDFAETVGGIGNPRIDPPRAQHYSAGVEQLLGERLKLTLEGFYKWQTRLIVNSPVPGENLNNDGIGRIYGLETSARLRPTSKSSGFLSYTLSRSERRDHAGQPWRLFNWDQTHILTVAAAYRLGGAWDLSGTFRYVSGLPYTPVTATIYNANTDTYRPIYGQINGARGSAFHRLDVRLERVFKVKGGLIAAYLDVQNAYNRQSEDGRVFNYNYTQSKGIPGLPIIPGLGVRGEL
jgi:TonB family protein